MTGNWSEDYKRKFVSAEEAVKVIKSGDRVAFTHGREPLALGLALAARKQQVKDVRIFLPNPYTDFGWKEEQYPVLCPFLRRVLQ